MEELLVVLILVLVFAIMLFAVLPIVVAVSYFIVNTYSKVSIHDDGEDKKYTIKTVGYIKKSQVLPPPKARM